MWNEEDRPAKLAREKPSLNLLTTAVPWEDFRPLLESAFEKERKSPAGRKRTDVIVMFKVRNRRQENEDIKQGKVPEGWQDNPNRLRQKDLDARWTQKNGVNRYGYKNSISIDAVHGLIRSHVVTPAAIHDS